MIAMTSSFPHTLFSGLKAATAASLLLLLSASLSAGDNWHTPAVEGQGGKILLRTVLVEDEDEQPAVAGAAAAKQLLAAIGDAPLQAVLVSECFEDLELKQELLQGICSVIPKERVFGSSTYGSFTQQGTAGFDSVCLLGIAGDGISVAAALVTEMGVAKLTFEENESLIKERLNAAGRGLVGKLRRTFQDRLLILMADAHSPKNQHLVDGVQQVVGTYFPVTGGSANKNAGQTFVYFQGKAYADSAVALMLSGDFQVGLSGRKAMDNDLVISSAWQGAKEVVDDFRGEPVGVLAFNCAGRRGKLQRPEDELAAIQKALGDQLPLFGCYCAGEVGPLDPAERSGNVLSGGSGWHVMFTVLGR
jgi:hypothetical protein